MTSKTVEIVPPFHHQGNGIPSSAIRWPGFGDWPSGHSQITKIRPSDRCGGKTIPAAMQFGYNLREFGGYLGNVGLNVRRDICVGMAFALVVMGSCTNEAERPTDEVHSGWSVPFDGTDSQPVVHDGVLYVGSFDGAVYAFDVTTGQQKWRYQTGESLTSGPEII